MMVGWCNCAGAVLQRFREHNRLIYTAAVIFQNEKDVIIMFGELISLILSRKFWNDKKKALLHPKIYIRNNDQ